MGVYNGANYLKEAVNSILDQTLREIELIVVDDCSNDESSTILESYSDSRLIVIRNPENIGLTDSLNKALKHSRGKYIARMDADDISTKDRLKIQYEFMEKNPEITVSGSQINFIDEFGRRSKNISKFPITKKAINLALVFSTPVAHPTAIFRRDIICEEFRGYDSAYQVAQDIELWSRVTHCHKITNIADELLTMRIHGKSVTADVANPRRKKHFQIWSKKYPEIIRNILGIHLLDERWGEWWLLSQKNKSNMTSNEIQGLFDGILAIDKAYKDKADSDLCSKEISEIISNAKAKIAIYALSTSRSLALRFLYSAFNTNPKITAWYFKKFFAIFLMGNNAKKIYNFLMGIKVI